MNTTESEAYRLAYELEYAAKYPNVRMAGDHEMLKSAAAELKRLWQLAYVDKPAAQWVGLTNEDIIEMWPQTSTVGWDDIRLIEAKLKEMNT